MSDESKKYPAMLYKGGEVSDDPANYRIAADAEEQDAAKADGFLPPAKKKAEK